MESHISPALKGHHFNDENILEIRKKLLKEIKQQNQRQRILMLRLRTKKLVDIG